MSRSERDEEKRDRVRIKHRNTFPNIGEDCRLAVIFVRQVPTCVDPGVTHILCCLAVTKSNAVGKVWTAGAPDLNS